MTKNQTSFKKGNQYWRMRAKEHTGRPSKYDPEFCDMIIAMGRDGLSVPEMAAEFFVARSTIDEWARSHPDFSEALAMAKTLAEAYWTRYGMDRLTMKEFQGNTWVKAMQARFRDNWTERRELSGPNGGPIHTKVDDGKVADAERLIAELANRNDACAQTGSTESDPERSAPVEAIPLADDSPDKSASTE